MCEAGSVANTNSVFQGGERENQESTMERAIYKSEGVSMVSTRPVTNLDDFFSAAVNSTLHVNSKGNKNIVAKMLKETRSKDQLVNRLE